MRCGVLAAHPASRLQSRRRLEGITESTMGSKRALQRDKKYEFNANSPAANLSAALRLHDDRLINVKESSAR